MYYETEAKKNKKTFSRTIFWTKYIEIIDKEDIPFHL